MENDWLEIRNGTTVEFVAGGSFSGANSSLYLDGSHLVINGGDIQTAYGIDMNASSLVMESGSFDQIVDASASSVLINGGVAGVIGAQDGSSTHTTVTGGTIGRLGDGYHVVSGGVIGDIFWEVGSLTMTGGAVTGTIQTYAGGAKIYGGIFDGTRLIGYDAGPIMLYGAGFTIGGVPVDYGAVGSWDPDPYSNPVNLQGTPLLGGTYDFVASPIPGTLYLVPEPGTAALLGMGLVGLAMRGRRRRRSV